MSDRTSIGYVLDQLENEGFVLEEKVKAGELEEYSNTNLGAVESLMGCGGWIAAIFFLGFSTLCISTIFYDLDERAFGWMLLILGAIFAGATTAIYRSNTAGIFQSQLLLALHIAGHFLIIGGVMMAFELWNYDSLVPLAIIIIVVELSFLFLYPDAILRFISTASVVFALNLLVYDLGITGSLSILIAGLALLVVIIWGDLLNPQQQIGYFSLLQPVGYALVLGMFGTVMHELSIPYDTYAEYTRASLYQPFITSFLLLVLLLWTEIRLLNDYNIPLKSRFSLFAIGITILVALPTMTTPGILAGILVILLAFRRRNWSLLGLAYLFFVGFIVEYYYSLEATLLTKSIILMITGALLIFGRLLLRRIVAVPEPPEGGAA